MVLICTCRLSGQEYSGKSRSLTVKDTCFIKGIYAVGYKKIPERLVVGDKIEFPMDSKQHAFFIPVEDSKKLRIEDLKRLFSVKMSDTIFLDYRDSEILYYVENGDVCLQDNSWLSVDSIASMGKPIEIYDHSYYVVTVEACWVRIDVPSDSSDLITEAHGNKYTFVQGATTKVFYPIKLLKANNLRVK